MILYQLGMLFLPVKTALIACQMEMRIV
jgi:hypothetical protein